MISVITPTYNREKLLDELYDSLRKQTEHDFEWIVVDDGSVDQTEEKVGRYIKETEEFEIRYLKKENGGKHRAVNFAMPYVRGEYVFIVDSDDCLACDAIQRVTLWCRGIERLEKLAGVAGLRAYKTGEVIGQSGPPGSEFVEATNLERKKHRLLGDKAEIYKTEILKKYAFPEFPGETFLSEEAVWNSIARDGYKLRWYRRVIYYTEYRTDGLTAAVDSGAAEKKNFCGYTYVQKLNFHAYKSPVTKLMIFTLYSRSALEMGLKWRRICEVFGLSQWMGGTLFALGRGGLFLKHGFSKK